jgi:hypothetical protein
VRPVVRVQHTGFGINTEAARAADMAQPRSSVGEAASKARRRGRCTVCGTGLPRRLMLPVGIGGRCRFRKREPH